MPVTVALAPACLSRVSRAVVLGATHRITHRTGKGLALRSECRRGGQCRTQQQSHQPKPKSLRTRFHQFFSFSISNNIVVRWADRPSRASMSHRYRCARIPEVPLSRHKKNGGNSLARAPAICPEKLGEGHRAKSLTGYAFARKVTNLGDEFPKPEHGGLPARPGNRHQKGLGSQEVPPPAINSSLLRIPCARPHQVYCGAFTV